MREFILEHYFVFKALHIIAVICWMVGLLYLPRLFVYHVGAKKGSEMYKTFVIMEEKLLRIIMNPAMIASFVLGFAMLWAMGFAAFGKWLHVKLLLVFLMAGLHGFLAYNRKLFILEKNRKSALFFRVLNEVPAVIMVVVVLLAVTKPF
jgi:putative membrane protein